MIERLHALSPVCARSGVAVWSRSARLRVPSRTGPRSRPVPAPTGPCPYLSSFPGGAVGEASMQKGRLVAAPGPAVRSAARLRPRAAALPLRRAILVAALFVRWLESLLATVIAEDAGGFDATLEPPEQLLERLTLAGDHVHRVLLLPIGPRVRTLAVCVKQADLR